MLIKSFISGGAKGSDLLFGMLAKENNIPCFNMSFRLHNCSSVGERIVLSQVKLDTRKADLELIRKVLKKQASKNSYIENLMLRNTFQIKSAKGTLVDLVIAIAEFENNMHNVIGGTGYAVAYAQYLGVPVIVLNKNNLKFYYYNREIKKFVLMQKGDLENILPEKEQLVVTGIGSREIKENLVKPRIERLISAIQGNTIVPAPVEISEPVVEPEMYNLPDEEVPMVQGTLC